MVLCISSKSQNFPLDYNPVINDALTTTDIQVSFTISATDDEAILEEDSITLTFTSAHEDL